MAVCELDTLTEVSGTAKSILDLRNEFGRRQYAPRRGPVLSLEVAAKGKRFVYATVYITTPLSGEDLCARLHRSGKCYPYSYTCKFDGITPLYEDEKGADVDVIAVTGLGGHALGSWKSRNSDEVWLRDFLPEDMPNIRVLLYSYDTMLPGSQSRQSIGDLGSAFLEQVTAFRANDGVSGLPYVSLRPTSVM
ncbi:hypothetical protein PENFLA_c053G03067 [Penicillium flavigenum]|uniref:Uncharacterized protein n=1 Tax=Penicillium flavigenum TaxID=254877 RepID=A0A1V6SHF4_9EURO|nr:hypothetical protein PENFLA_c053G03067 [Penicillium flavigenum]